MSASLVAPPVALLEADPQVARPTLRTRILAIDRLRLAASMLMIEGHVFTLSVRPGIRASASYAWHDVVHGFTAPMFLFAAGLSFGSADAKAGAGRSRAETLRKFERYATLALLGYLLHLGRYTLADLGVLEAPELRRVVLVDALQCVGVTLAFVHGLRLVVRSPARFRGLVFGACVAVVAASPAIDRLDTGSLPAALAAYLDHDGGSLFPLFPWSGYALAGVVVSGVVARARSDGDTRSALSAASIGIACVGFALGRTDPGWFGEHDYWLTSPLFFLVRLGVLGTVVAGLLAAESVSAGSDRSAVMRRLAGETLCLYLVHLAILYGTPLSRGVRRYVEHRLDLGTAAALTLAIGAFTVMVALAFSRAKETHGPRIDVIRRTLLGAILVRFVVVS